MEIRNSVNYANSCGSEYKTQQSNNNEFRQLVDKLTGGKMVQEIRENYDVTLRKDTMDESTIFHTEVNIQYQRKLQKKKEERELKERREQKERMEEALEAYTKYRRELRHYYNELGYQKKLAVSNGDLASSVNVKRPPVVSAAYELIMMLGM